MLSIRRVSFFESLRLPRNVYSYFSVEAQYCFKKYSLASNEESTHINNFVKQDIYFIVWFIFCKTTRR